MPIDLFSVIQDGKRSLSFFSQCIGLMAELDLWTEHLRFLGSKYEGLAPLLPVHTLILTS